MAGCILTDILLNKDKQEAPTHEEELVHLQFQEEFFYIHKVRTIAKTKNTVIQALINRDLISFLKWLKIVNYQNCLSIFDVCAVRIKKNNELKMSFVTKR